MKKALLLGVICLVFAGSAEASTTLSPESGTRYQYARWIARSHVPTPDVEVTVHDQTCPFVQASGCTQGAEVWIDPAQSWVIARMNFMHELGHQMDYFQLTEEDRDELLAAMDLEGPWRVDGDQKSPHELFADTYSGCALNNWHWRFGLSERPALMPRPRMRSACAAIARLRSGS